MTSAVGLVFLTAHRTRFGRARRASQRRLHCLLDRGGLSAAQSPYATGELVRYNGVAPAIMANPVDDDVTALLIAWGEGNRYALDRLIPLVYQDLRRRAHRELRRERSDGTIGTTALVNEAYLHLVDQRRARLENRFHFLNVAAQLMRRVLIDEARKARALKRGAGAPVLALDEIPEPSAQSPDLLALDDALTRLERFDPRLGRIVELRYFGGLTLEETAEMLDTSVTSVWREWNTAKAWLYDALNGQ
jgi:RNA polymerase sigma factor (TIGR02999 family)